MNVHAYSVPQLQHCSLPSKPTPNFSVVIHDTTPSQPSNASRSIDATPLYTPRAEDIHTHIPLPEEIASSAPEIDLPSPDNYTDNNTPPQPLPQYLPQPSYNNKRHFDEIEEKTVQQSAKLQKVLDTIDSLLPLDCCFTLIEPSTLIPALLPIPYYSVHSNSIYQGDQQYDSSEELEEIRCMLNI